MSEQPEPFRAADIALSARSSVPVDRLCVDLAGLRVHALSRPQWADVFVGDLAAMRRSGHALRPRVMTSANGNVLSLYHRAEPFRRMVDEADGIDADGMSLVFASRFVGGPRLPERVATTDFVHDLGAVGARARATFFLLGGTGSSNRRACARLETLYPGLTVVGRNGYFDREDHEAVVTEIASYRPDLVLVGMGVPRELEMALFLRDRLPGVTWIKTCGGLFDFLSGKNTRAPQLLQRLGLEWAYRTWLEPRRLLWRYLSTNTHTLLLLTRHRVRPGARRRGN